MISNEIIKSKLGITTVMDKMQEARLIWFGHMTIRYIRTHVIRWKKNGFHECKRDEGRVKDLVETIDVIRQDVRHLKLVENLARKWVFEGLKVGW